MITVNLKRHMQKNHSANRFFCNSCSKSYSVSFFKHYQVYKNEFHLNEYPIKQKAHLKKHCMTVHNFTSDQFNVKYPRPGSSSPNGSSKSTLKEKAFKCSKCPKRYTQKELIFTQTAKFSTLILS